jgi:hypothetical protein
MAVACFSALHAVHHCVVTGNVITVMTYNSVRFVGKVTLKKVKHVTYVERSDKIGVLIAAAGVNEHALGPTRTAPYDVVKNQEVDNSDTKVLRSIGRLAGLDK